MTIDFIFKVPITQTTFCIMMQCSTKTWTIEIPTLVLSDTFKRLRIAKPSLLIGNGIHALNSPWERDKELKSIKYDKRNKGKYLHDNKLCNDALVLEDKSRRF